MFNEFIGFYPREFFCLDNFSSFGIIYKKHFYPTIEHAYQAEKFIKSAPNIAEKIKKSLSAHDAQKIAYSNKGKVCLKWDDNKLKFMEKLLMLKIKQNLYVKQKLLETNNYLICEDSPKDSFWGIGENRTGRNELGKLWMKLRSDLQKNSQVKD